MESAKEEVASSSNNCRKMHPWKISSTTSTFAKRSKEAWMPYAKAN
jgi:hypothetical protein